MIDVMLQLLIIFHRWGPSSWRWSGRFRWKCPGLVDAGGPDRRPASCKVVNVYRDGQITLDANRSPACATWNAHQASAEVRRQYSDQAVLVAAMPRASSNSWPTCWPACKQAGIRELGIAVLPGRHP